MEQIVDVFNRVTGDWDAREKHIPSHIKSGRAAFEFLNESRKGGLVKVFEKTTPLCADFYIQLGEAEEIEVIPFQESFVRQRAS